ncbi:hypothetical protein KIW84_056950 [Lathyrus oleraceus]|uniref:RNase H type-1 domain-containing protein n=1 Tax=Pisum sativum TaxID=3888 RepID=A0A9D4X1V6_PEA|nr:hypothetical protein KIW84_056950 [Pisum sativum]
MGLGLRFIATLNYAFNMKLCWDLPNSSESWALMLKSRLLRDGIPFKYHITSSIWSNIKSEVEGVSNNTRIILSDGRNTNFLLDHWCDPHLISRIQDPEDINTNHWCLIFYIMVLGIGALNAELSFRLPLGSSSTIFGNITAKMVKSFMHEFTITKALNVDLHPYKAPRITEVLCLYPTIGIRALNAELSFRLPLGSSSITFGGHVINSNSTMDLYWKKTHNQILSEVAFIGNITAKMVRSSMHEFTITKTFNVDLHPHKAPRIVEVLWFYQANGWFKCNTSIARSSTIIAELFGVIKTIAYASSFGWNSVWLETDSSFVLLDVKDPFVVP